MEDAPMSVGPNWVENAEGDIKPPDVGLYPEPELNDEEEHQKSVEQHRAENPDYIEPTDINPAEYDLDEASMASNAVHRVRLADPELDAEWHKIHDQDSPAVPTSSLSNAQQIANARKHEAAHRERTAQRAYNIDTDTLGK